MDGGRRHQAELRRLLELVEDTCEIVLLAPPRSERAHDELYVIWSAARAEANLAFDDWSALPGPLSYAAYRAAEDRADAAQDALAAAVRATAPRLAA